MYRGRKEEIMKNDFISNVFGWMFIGLLITFGSGYLITNSPDLIRIIFSNSFYWIIFIVQIVIALVMGVRLQKMKPVTAKILYILYTALTGVTFASIFLLYEVTSILLIFLVTGITFGLFALIGKNLKINMNKIGTFLLIGLFAIIILEIINIFLLSNTLNLMTCIFAIIIFVIYVAYDMQKIMRISESGYGNENLAIYGAFQFYLDFINIFIRLISLFGKRRD